MICDPWPSEQCTGFITFLKPIVNSAIFVFDPIVIANKFFIFVFINVCNAHFINL